MHLENWECVIKINKEIQAKLIIAEGVHHAFDQAMEFCKKEDGELYILRVLPGKQPTVKLVLDSGILKDVVANREAIELGVTAIVNELSEWKPLPIA